MPSPRRATIADVAAASGVGVGTVSRVINGAPNVREATRTSVLKVIDQLGYRPSHLAASLSRGTARTMAIVVPHLTRPSVVMRLAGALTVLDEQGYDTVVCNVDTPGQRDHHLAALTRRHRADGVMVVSLRLSRQQLESFRRAGVPLVTVGVLAPGVPQTITDDVMGGRLATEHLLPLGHRRIGFVGDVRHPTAATDLGFTASQHRLSGYRQALAAAGIGYDPGLVRRGPFGPANAEALARVAEQALGRRVFISTIIPSGFIETIASKAQSSTESRSHKIKWACRRGDRPGRLLSSFAADQRGERLSLLVARELVRGLEVLSAEELAGQRVVLRDELQQLRQVVAAHAPGRVQHRANGFIAGAGLAHHRLQDAAALVTGAEAADHLEEGVARRALDTVLLELPSCRKVEAS